MSWLNRVFVEQCLCWIVSWMNSVLAEQCLCWTVSWLNGVLAESCLGWILLLWNGVLAEQYLRWTESKLISSKDTILKFKSSCWKSKPNFLFFQTPSWFHSWKSPNFYCPCVVMLLLFGLLFLILFIFSRLEELKRERYRRRAKTNSHLCCVLFILLRCTKIFKI
jgi:hypothetical protein